MKLPIETRIKLNRFQPRPYQVPLFDAIENRGIKRAVLVWHRRAGKDVACFNLIIRQALKVVGAYYYILPTYRQARLVLFEGMTSEGQRFMDYIPKEIITKINIQEMKITLINGSLLYFLGSDNFDCYDSQTEILTEDGWKLFKDLNRTEKVATLDNGEMVFNLPTAYQEYDYDGVMYGVKNSSVDFLVTPNHRFFVYSSKGFSKFKVISDPTIKGDKIPSTCIWNGKYKKIIMGYDSKDFMAFLGIYLSEGSAYKSKTGKGYQITISQTKEHIRKEIFDLLTRMNLKFYSSKGGFQFCSKRMYEYLIPFGLQHDRYIPKDIKSLSTDLLRVLFDWLIKGDGHSSPIYTSYYSTSKRLIDDVQEIILKIGFSGNLHIKPQLHSEIKGRIIHSKKILYEVRVRKSKFKRFVGASSKQYIFQEDYIGKVYCVSVPSGVIKVRRNGKEIWSGNSLRGSNPKGIIFSEYAYQHPSTYPTLRPILVANDGWCVFISTPFGQNHFYQLYEVARHSSDWFCDLKTVEDTDVVSPESIEQEEQEGLMSRDMIEQEYYCSFSTGALGSYYARYLNNMELNNQITDVVWEPSFPVYTAWDLGLRDQCVIIFFQVIGTSVHIIDLYSNNTMGMEHYVGVVLNKPYRFSKHFAPHDIAVREFGSGMSRYDKAKELGIKFEMRANNNELSSAVPNVSIMDGIESVRSTLPKIWIDKTKCKDLIRAIRDYRKEYDAKRKIYKTSPLHDSNSDFCDALRYLCLSLKFCRKSASPEDLDRRYMEALSGSNSNMPEFFR